MRFSFAVAAWLTFRAGKPATAEAAIQSRHMAGAVVRRNAYQALLSPNVHACHTSNVSLSIPIEGDFSILGIEVRRTEVRMKVSATNRGVHGLGRLIRIAVEGLCVAAALFILSTLLFGILKDSSPSSIDPPSVGYAFLTILLFFAVYNLEGIQQAANSTSELDESVVQQVTRSERVTKAIYFDRTDYDQLSAARQLMSVLAILATKGLLNKLAAPPISPISSPFLTGVAEYLQSPTLQFLSAAIFIAVYLQLLPKRLAKADPILYFNRLRRFTARALKMIGNSGLDRPVDRASIVMSLMTGKSNARAEYPLSNRKVLQELGKRNGFYVEHLRVRFHIAKDKIMATEEAIYRISDKKPNFRSLISGITHRITLGGTWYPEKMNSSVDGEAVTSHKVEYTQRHETTHAFFDNSLEAPEPDPELDYDEENDGIIKIAGWEPLKSEEPPAIFTQLSVHAKFTKPISRQQRPDALISISTKLIYSDFIPGRDSDYQTRSFQISVQVPIEKLSIVITTSGDEPPKDVKLTVRDIFDWPDQTVRDFEILDRDQLQSSEKHGILIRHMLPNVGNRLSIAVDV
jgi:hypothetical protein